MHLFNRFNDALDKDLSDSFYLSEEKYLQFWYARGTSFLVYVSASQSVDPVAGAIFLTTQLSS